MAISIQMYTLRDYMKTYDGVKDTLAKVAGIGYKYVQISVPPFMKIEELKALLDSNGLKADSLMAPVASVEAGIEMIVKNAGILGTDVVRTDGIPYKLVVTEEGCREYAAALERCGRLLKRNGLKFMYHNHAIEYINFENCTGMDIFLEETLPEHVMFQPDVHHIAAAGAEPSAALKAFKGRCEYVHMQGYAIIPGEGFDKSVPRRTVPVGTGNLNWIGIVKTCKEIGVRLFVVEQDWCIGDPFEEIALSYGNLLKMGVKSDF
ncbi:MAG: sugar phosphate isomerase/epimerase [Eubacteriales bacterium]|nr:sugar phosphate isomerase/epimerase [Eubacteriales bacterium]